MDLTKEDIKGVVTRALERWENIEGEFRYQMTRVVDQDLAIAGKKLADAGGALCANLRYAPDNHPFPHYAPVAVDRWNQRAVTFEKAVKMSSENAPGRLEFAVDLVAAGKNLVMLLESLVPPLPCEPPAPKDEDPLVARIRQELWAPGKLPTPESVAAFVQQAVVSAAPVELALQSALELNKTYQRREEIRELALTFFAKAAAAVNDAERKFLQDVVCELARAKVKYPDPRRRFAALVSEVGEVATAFLKETPDRVYDEAVQVAVVALRIATEGDPTLERPEGRNGGWRKCPQCQDAIPPGSNHSACPRKSS